MQTVLAFFIFLVLNSATSESPPTSPSSDTSIMNIWNYQIERKVKTSVAYKIWDLAVWEEVGPNPNSTTGRLYYVTPPVTYIAGSARCTYIPILKSYDVVYDVQLWEHELARVVVERLKELGSTVGEDQVFPLPFYQARIVWNNAEQSLQGLKLASAWINNLQQQKTYSFHVAADSNASCQLLAETLQTNPRAFIDFVQLQFTVSAAKIDSKLLTIKSQHIISSQLASSLKNLPGADGAYRYLSSKDYNQMLMQIANQAVATEITSGDYVDAEDELSLKDTVASMLNAQKENVGNFDDRMWNSTFWDPSDSRPDRVTKEMNKYFKMNQTDGRWYMSESHSSSTSAAVNAIIKLFTFGASASHSSSNSKTTDQMQHLLEQYDTESEIDGDKFIPKKLDLFRLNVNDMGRDDLVTEKRVRVRQMEIGGVLQVAVGNSSLGQIEDENRYLRQQISDMQQQGKDMQQHIINSDQAAKTAQNQLQQSINTARNQLQESINNLVSRITHSASSRPGGTCTHHETRQVASLQYTPDMGASARWLESQDVSCPEGKFMTRFEVIDVSYNFHFEYTCCSVI